MMTTSIEAALGFAFRTRDYFQLAGEKPAIGNAAFETVMADTIAGNLYVPPSTPTTVRVAAGGNAADASAGTGAQQVTVTGLDLNNQVVSATLTLAGASASAFSTQEFLRVNSVAVTRAGSGGTNVGNIQIENQTGTGTNSGFILAGRGLSQTAFYSVPQGSARDAGAFTASSGVGAYLQDGIFVSVHANPADVRLIQLTRNTTNNLPASIILWNLPALPVGEHFIHLPAPLRIQRPASIGDLTDVGVDLTIQAKATTGTADLNVRAGGYFQSAT